MTATYHCLSCGNLHPPNELFICGESHLAEFAEPTPVGPLCADCFAAHIITVHGEDCQPQWLQ